MYKRILSAFQLLNLLFQALYSLAFPIGVGALISFLLTKYASLPKWIFAIFLTLGTFIGLYSMVKYILSATEQMERVRKEQALSDEEKRKKAETQARLCAELDNDESDGEKNG